jgi:hypothetical protein
MRDSRSGESIFLVVFYTKAGFPKAGVHAKAVSRKGAKEKRKGRKGEERV